MSRTSISHLHEQLIGAVRSILYSAAYCSLVGMATMAAFSASGDNDSARSAAQQNMQRESPSFEHSLNEEGLAMTDSVLEDFADLSTVAAPDFEWSVELDAVLLRSSTEHMPLLLAQSKDMPHDAKRLLAQEEIFRRFAALDPHLAMLQAESFPHDLRLRFNDIVLSEWAINDVEGAIEHTASHRLFQDRRRTLERIVLVRDDLEQGLLSRLLHRHGLGEFVGGVMDVTEETIVHEDPEAAWFEILGAGADYVHDQRELFDIARIWIDEEGLEALIGIEESIPYWSTRQTLMSQALSYAAKLYPKETFAMALDMFAHSNWDLVMTVANQWARSDRDAALAAFGEVDSRALRQRLLDVAIKQAIVDDPRALLAQPEILPDVIRAVGSYQAVRLIDELSPEVVTGLIAKVGEESSEFIHFLVTRWASENFDDALNWILDAHEIEGRREDLFMTLMEDMDVIKATRTLEAVRQRPMSDLKAGEGDLEALVIGQIAQLNPDRASETLSGVREVTTLMVSYVAVGAGYLIHNDHNRAIELGKQLPESQRLQYYDGLFEFWSETDPDQAYRNVNRLPSPNAKSQAALQLIERNLENPVFSKRRIERLKTFLTEEDTLTLEE